MSYRNDLEESRQKLDHDLIRQKRDEGKAAFRERMLVASAETKEKQEREAARAAFTKTVVAKVPAPVHFEDPVWQKPLTSKLTLTQKEVEALIVQGLAAQGLKVLSLRPNHTDFFDLGVNVFAGFDVEVEVVPATKQQTTTTSSTVVSWRDEPATKGQISALRRFGVNDIPRSKGEASDQLDVFVAAVKRRLLGVAAREEGYADWGDEND